MRILALLGVIAACNPPASSPATTPASPPVVAAAPVSPPVVAAAAPSMARREDAFDYKVRADFFDGLRGDTVALDRAIKLCEDTLAREPNHAEAMVWHGAGVMARASLAFRAGDRPTGVKLYQQGLAEMDRAVALAPSKVGVRIPRGAVLLVVAGFVPEPEKTKLVTRGASDYEVGLAGQESYFAKLTLHAREQMLYGLTDAFATLGDTRKANAYYQRMMTDAAGSELLARAKARAAGEAVSGPTPCAECHARGTTGPAHR
jgi:hypothetical protein